MEVDTSFLNAPPHFPNFFYGLLPQLTGELNPMVLGNIPSGVFGSSRASSGLVILAIKLHLHPLHC